MFANVPRVITRSFPRLEPYELKSRGWTPLAMRYLPAGLSAGIDPAGEIWSVVMESPKNAKTLASCDWFEIRLSHQLSSIKKGGS